MTDRLRPLHPALALAALIAGLEICALGIECSISLTKSFGEGKGLLEALFLFARYFTILTNGGIAVLMALTVWRLRRGRPMPAAGSYAAALVYILVVSITYEAILRRLWSPLGMQFYTDMTMHDIVPVLMLVFWIAFAPKAPIRWSAPLRWLEFPIVYFAVILLSGFFVEDYPYRFLDPDKIGYGGVAESGVLFLAFFYALGLAVTGAARALTRIAPSLLTYEKSLLGTDK